MIPADELLEYYRLCGRRRSNRNYQRRRIAAAKAGLRPPDMTPKRDWVRTAITRARRRALYSFIPFSLVREDLSLPKDCPICGISFVYKPQVNSPSRRAAATLDRIIPHLGYVAGNVAIICYRCNTIKQDATAQEIRRVADWLDGVVSNG